VTRSRTCHVQSRKQAQSEACETWAFLFRKKGTPNLEDTLLHCYTFEASFKTCTSLFEASLKTCTTLYSMLSHDG